MSETLTQLKAQQQPIAHAGIAFVELAGNDSTAVIGNPALPFATAQGAYDAVAGAGSGNFVIHFGVGTFGGISEGAIGANVMFSGAGRFCSSIGGFTLANDGGTIHSDKTVDLGGVTVVGDTGANGAQGADQIVNGTPPGNGADGSPGADASLVLIGCASSGDIDVTGGTGGGGGNGGNDIPQADGGTGSDVVQGGNGGNGGNATLSLTDCHVTGTINVNADDAGGAGNNGEDSTGFSPGDYDGYNGQNGTAFINMQTTAYSNVAVNNSTQVFSSNGNTQLGF